MSLKDMYVAQPHRQAIKYNANPSNEEDLVESQILGEAKTSLKL